MWNAKEVAWGVVVKVIVVAAVVEMMMVVEVDVVVVVMVVVEEEELVDAADAGVDDAVGVVDGEKGLPGT